MNSKICIFLCVTSQCNFCLFFSKFCCHGNTFLNVQCLGPKLWANLFQFCSLKYSDSIFELAIPENPILRAKCLHILYRSKICAILAFLSKFGCHGNSLCSLNNSDSILQFVDLEKPTIRRKNMSRFLAQNWIQCNFADFCLNLVAMATPINPLKIPIVSLTSPTP